jgi:hypothetical protein
MARFTERRSRDNRESKRENERSWTSNKLRHDDVVKYFAEEERSRYE